MKLPEIQPNEHARLEALAEYNILDTVPEKEFDDITKLASTICGTPISLIGLIDARRKWYKSHFGTEKKEMPREYSLCAHAILKPKDILVVPDSRIDDRFVDNPALTKEPPVVFYVGVPLTNEEGFALGTLCIIDHEPREISEDQLGTLRALANQVVKLLELRRSNIRLNYLRQVQESRYAELEKFAHVVAHDIKSPLANIAGLTSLIKTVNEQQEGGDTSPLLDQLSESTHNLKSLVDGILEYYKGDRYATESTQELSLNMLLQTIVDLLDTNHQHEISLPKIDFKIDVNKSVLEQIFINLIANAIKYNDKESVKIDIDFYEDAHYYYFQVMDNGMGIEGNDQDRVFDLFTTLDKKDRHGGKGSGIGLASVKKLVTSTGGSINVKSKMGEGSVFDFKLKKI